MGRTLAWRLVFGLFVLALLSTSQGKVNETTAAPHSNSSVTSASLHINSTTKGHGNYLQSTTGLFIFSVSLLYFC